jgi:hypothetical protein
MASSTEAPAVLGYARRALNHAKNAWIDIKVDHMSLSDALYWDATIQRDIVAEGLRAKGRGQPAPRADFFWSWAGIRLLFPLAQLLKRRRCRGLTIFVRDSAGRGVPAGMMLLIERYPWPLPEDSIRQSTFTWFIASAPPLSLRNRGVADPPSLGRIMVDAAMVASHALGLKGQMWLHAAPAGGPGLVRLYGTICQMSSLPLGWVLPGGGVSDGRHYYAGAPLAQRLMDALQLSR